MSDKMRGIWIICMLVAALLLVQPVAAEGESSGGILEAIIDFFTWWIPESEPAGTVTTLSEGEGTEIPGTNITAAPTTEPTTTPGENVTPTPTPTPTPEPPSCGASPESPCYVTSDWPTSTTSETATSPWTPELVDAAFVALAFCVFLLAALVAAQLRRPR